MGNAAVVEKPPNQRDKQLIEIDDRSKFALERNISSYRWMAVLESIFAVGLPIFVPLWKGSGMSMSEIFLLQGVFALAIVLSEVPTGYMADLLGRRRSLVVGYVLIATSSIIYACADSFWMFLVGEVMVGIGFSFRSGADVALLFESLKRLNRSEQYLAITARANSQFFVASAVLTILGGFLATIDIRLPLFAIAAVNIWQFWLALRTVEPVGLVAAHHPYLTEVLNTASTVLLKNQRTRWLALPPALIAGSLVISLWLYQPTFERVGVELQFVGALFALQSLVAAAASRLSPSISRFMTESQVLLVCTLLLVVGYIGMAGSNMLLAVGGGFLLQIVRVVPNTILGGSFQHLISSARRATAMSLVSMLTRFSGFVAMSAATLLAYGLPDQGVLLVWGACSGVMVMVCVVLLRAR